MSDGRKRRTNVNFQGEEEERGETEEEKEGKAAVVAVVVAVAAAGNNEWHCYGNAAWNESQNRRNSLSSSQGVLKRQGTCEVLCTYMHVVELVREHLRARNSL